MNIRIAKIAQQEFEDAKEFYEMGQAGLGNRFEDEVKNSFLRIQQYPTAWPIERDEVRHYLLHKFPFKILYSIQDNDLIVLAIAHQHRKPNYWIDRIKQMNL